MRKFTIWLSCLFLIASMGFANAQTKTITGKVTSSEDGLPIPGVTVMVPGTTVGTTTDFDGTYSLTVSQNITTLRFSYIGMESQDVQIGNQTVINVVLKPSATTLDEVVVTAYGAKGRGKIKGAISTVFSEELEQMPIATFDQALQGKTTGIYVSSGSGQPGTTDTRVQIRGISTVQGNTDPLYVIDGVPVRPGEFAALNFNDFETMSILKDASATAIYGSRAANGVILITTKQGKEGKTKVNYRFQTGWSDPTRTKFDMMNSTQKLSFEELAKRGPGWTLSPNNPANAGLSAEALAANATELERLKNINTDWSKIFTRTGKTSSHEINITGGNDKTTFYTSFQYFQQEGQALRSDLERVTGRLNLGHKIKENLRLNISASIGSSFSNRIESEGGIFLSNPFAAAYLANPYEVPYNEDGSIATSAGNVGANALDRILNSNNTRKDFKAIGSFSLEWDFLKNFTATSKFGIDHQRFILHRWINPNSYTGSLVVPGGAGSLRKYHRQFDNMTFTNTINYDGNIDDNKVISTIGGIEYIEDRDQAFGFTGYGLNPKLPNSVDGISDATADNGLFKASEGHDTKRALFSLFFIANLNWADKYEFYGSIRRDASSAFGANNQSAVLYSLGAAWTISKESFLNNIEWIDLLKIRSSYGTTGNQTGIDDYEALTTYKPARYNGQQGNTLARAGDPNIKWEIVSKLDVSVEYALFNNRLSGNLSFYNNITNDLFIQQSLSATAGVPDPTNTDLENTLDINAGKLRNRGIEFLFNLEVIKTKDFTWSIGGNLTYNDNEVLDLGQVTEFETGTSIIKVGLPLGTHYINGWAGVDPNTGDPLYYTKDGEVTNVFSANDLVANYGSSNPNLFGGFNTSLRYKNFDLSVDFSYISGYHRFNNQTFFQENPNFAQFNLSTIMLDVWQEPGDVTEVQRIGTNREFTSKDIEDASFLRLRNIMLSYTFDESFIKKSKVFTSLRIYAQAQNLFTWTKFTGFDPEDSNNIATYEYPASRTITVGIDIGL